MVRRVLFVGLLLATAASSHAQIIDRGGSGRSFGQPNAWASLGIGWLQMRNVMCDPDSNTCWDFGNAAQWRGSIEKPIGRGATIGGAATTARVPLIYGSAGTCNGCDADANVSQYLGLLHLGGGTGIQQAIDVTAGMTVFTNFRDRASGTKLAPMKAVSNFSFSVAYGLALPIKSNFHVTLSQEYGQIIGKRMSGVSSNSAQQNITRLGARVGLGL